MTSVQKLAERYAVVPDREASWSLRTATYGFVVLGALQVTMASLAAALGFGPTTVSASQSPVWAKGTAILLILAPLATAWMLNARKRIGALLGLALLLAPVFSTVSRGTFSWTGSLLSIAGAALLIRSWKELR